MATPLPMSGKLELPIQWSGTAMKKTQQTGGYSVETIQGLNPYVETTTLTWRLPMDKMGELIRGFKADKWLGMYSYTCPIMGPVVIRPTSNYSYVEDISRGQWQVSVDFRRIS